MPLPDTAQSAARGRWAVATMFFIGGFLTGSWAPQIPVFLTRFDISTFALSLLILVFGLGALTCMPLTGYLLARHGSRAVTRGFAAFASFGLLLVALAPGPVPAAPALYLFGGLIGGLDVAMNANAVAVERRLSRAVMSSSHGFWSLGGFAGAGLGGVAIQSFGYLAHAVAVTAVALALLAAAARHLVADDRPAPAQARRRFALPRSLPIYIVGLLALFSMVPEGAVLDWSALYLRQELGTGLATAGLAFSFFSGAMALMRFAGDAVRNRFGAVLTLRVSSLAATAGMLVAALSPWPWLTVAAFGFCGLGIANLVPIALSAGGNLPGVVPGTAISVITTMGYSGILVAPSAIGFAAEHVGFPPVFLVLSGLLGSTCLMAGLAAGADHAASPARDRSVRSGPSAKAR